MRIVLSVLVGALVVAAGRSVPGAASSILPPGLPPEVAARVDASPLRHHFLPPTRIVWRSEAGVKNAESLLGAKPGQAVLVEPVPPLELKGSAGAPAGILLDFGVEVQGYVELFTPMMSEQAKLRRVRIRFGTGAFLDDDTFADVRTSLPMPVLPSHDFVDVLTELESTGLHLAGSAR